MNVYAIEMLARDQLGSLRAAAAAHRLGRAVPRRPGPLRVTIGLALIQLGVWTLASAQRAPVQVPR